MNFLYKEAAGKSTEEQEELFKVLTEKALAKDHNGFEYIKNTTEFGIIKKTVSGLLKIITLYERIIKNLYKTYCAQVIQGTQDFNMLYALRQYQECKAFYESELAIAKDMLEEYDAYLGKGHFLDQFLFGHTREVWHLWDHRGVGPNGN